MLLGNLLIPQWLRHRDRPKIEIETSIERVWNGNRRVIHHRLRAVNHGKTVGRQSIATVSVQNATRENILDKWLDQEAVLKPDDFSLKALLEDPQRLSWFTIGNAESVDMVPEVPYFIDVLAISYPSQTDPRKPGSADCFIIPSERGWTPPRAILRPARYVLKVQLQGENFGPTGTLTAWTRSVPGGDPGTYEMSLAP